MNKPKFNLMDGLILVLIAAVVAAGALIFLGRDTAGSAQPQTKVAEYQVQFTQAEKEVGDKFLAALQSNEPLLVGEKERFSAELKDVQVEPAKKLVSNTRTGKTILAESPSKYDITLTLRSDVTESDTSILASGTPLLVGTEVAVKGKGMAGFGFIIDLEIVSQ